VGITERRQRERLELRTKILDAARDMFAKEGYEAVTMRKIAHCIEYSPTAIYFHFRDKDELFRELCAADFTALAQSFGHLLAISDPVERLRQVGRAYIEFALTHPNHYRLMFMTPHPAIDLGENAKMIGNPAQDAYAFLKLVIGECMREGAFRPEFQDVDQVAQMAWASGHGLVSLHIAKCKDPWIEWRPVRETASALVDATMRGMLHDPSRLGPAAGPPGKE
jgi:AcrR family transcriptional regulator